MNAPQKQPCSLLVGLVVGTLLFLWLSIWETAAQAQQQQRDCVADLFKEMQNLGIPVNLQKDPQDFKTDRNNAKNAIQNAIKANKLAAGEDTMFDKAVEAIACHLADTPNLPVVQAERQTRLKEAVAKLRNLFQRIANPVAGADDLKDWLAKLQFAFWPLSLGRNQQTNQYIWNILRLELIVDNTGAPREGVFAVPAGGVYIDLILLSKDKIGNAMATWQCPGGPVPEQCVGVIQDAIVLLKTKDVDNAAALLGAQQPDGTFAGGAGTLQEYATLALKHVATNANAWIKSYYRAAERVRGCVVMPAVIRRACWELPSAAFVVDIAFRNVVQNGNKVMTAITQDANVQNAAKAVVDNEIAKAKGVIVAWKEKSPQGAIERKYECRYISKKGLLARCLFTGGDINQFIGAELIVCEIYGVKQPC
jgi:hypothetical protein